VKVNVTNAADDTYSVYLGNSADSGILNLAGGGLQSITATADSGSVTVTGNGASTGVSSLAPASGQLITSITATLGALTAGTYKLYADTDGTFGGSTRTLATIVVVNAGAPKSVVWANSYYTEINASAVDKVLGVAITSSAIWGSTSRTSPAAVAALVSYHYLEHEPDGQLVVLLVGPHTQ